MGLIKCPECGKEISDKVSSCPNCGYPLGKNETMNKKIIWIIAGIFGIIALLVLLSGMSDLFHASRTESATLNGESDNPLLGKYYVGSVDYSAYVLRFNDDNTVDIIDCGLGRDTDPRKNIYGTYTVEKNALEINLSGGNSIVCVIHEDGDSLTVGGEEFDSISPDDLSDKTMEYFN